MGTSIYAKLLYVLMGSQLVIMFYSFPVLLLSNLGSMLTATTLCCYYQDLLFLFGYESYTALPLGLYHPIVELL